MAQAKIRGKSGPAGPTDAEIIESLRPFGLIPRDQVRFRRVEGGKWTRGVVAGVNKDGSLSIFEVGGKFRAIYANHCEVRREGPRGGTLWEPVRGGDNE